MQFDSTSYLTYYLIEKANLNEIQVDNCIGVLEGFIIRPGSIKYNEESHTLSFDAELPDSELFIHNISERNGELFINAVIIGHPEIAVNLSFELYNPSFDYSSLIINDVNSDQSGVYYYDPYVFYDNDSKYYMWKYYDYETITQIDEFLLGDLNISMEDLISYDDSRIKELGFSPDISKKITLEDFSEEISQEEMAHTINKRLKSITYEDIMERIRGFQEEYKSNLNPITYRKKWIYFLNCKRQVKFLY